MNTDEMEDPINIRGCVIQGAAADLLKRRIKLNLTFALNEKTLALRDRFEKLAKDETLLRVYLDPEVPVQLSLTPITEEPKMNLVNVILAQALPLPPIAASGYEYVVAANGLFIRAEDSRLKACIPVAEADLHGLVVVEPEIELAVPPIPVRFLEAVLESARRHLPNEAMYQFKCNQDGTWLCAMPLAASATPTWVNYQDDPVAVVDLHSHANMDAFFSETDDADETGLRFYCVIGKVDTDRPQIRLRIGVYGQHWELPASVLFEGLGPFVDIVAEQQEFERAELSVSEMAALVESKDGIGRGTELPVMEVEGALDFATGELIATRFTGPVDLQAPSDAPATI